MRRAFWWAVALLVTLWLLWMTLRPNAAVSGDLAVLTAPAAERGISIFWLIDIAGNIAVFAPLGAAVALALAELPPRRRWWWGTGAGAVLSAFIEGAQLMLSTRVSAWEDWVLNTVGAASGALLVIVASSYLERTRALQSAHYPIQNGED